MALQTIQTFKAVAVTLGSTEQTIYTCNVVGSGSMAVSMGTIQVHSPDGVTDYVVRAYMNGSYLMENRALQTDVVLSPHCFIASGGNLSLTVTSDFPASTAIFEGEIISD